MADNTSPDLTPRRARPWSWIPTLYLAEGFPYVLVMTVSTIMYTQLGMGLKEIGFWTSLLGFAWVVKPLWGPLVEAYWTKRRWTILMQIIIGICLGVTAMSLQTDWWWNASLLLLAAVALFSATHDIAADGFYMDALDEKQQSFFVGIRSTFYRISMIFGQGILLIIAGLIQQRTGPAPSDILVQAGPKSAIVETAAAREQGFVKFDPPVLKLASGETTTVTVTLTKAPEKERQVTISRVTSSFLSNLFPFGAEYDVSLADKKYESLKFDSTSWNQPQEIVFSADKNLKEPVTVPFRAASGNLPLTWAVCFGGMGLLMLGIGLYHMLALPKPNADGRHEKPTTPFIVAAGVVAAVVAIPIAIYSGLFYTINPAVHWIAEKASLAIPEPIYTLSSIVAVILVMVGLYSVPPIKSAFKAFMHTAARISNVPFDEVFGSFFSKPGIVPMVAFLLIYRLGEALLVKMSGPFLVKPLAEGGMGLSSGEYGLAYGTVGIIALTLGGILGGWAASRGGLKRWIFFMCFAINVPDALYVYLAYYQPAEFWKVLLCVSGESFGYGFGFTAYMLYMLYIAGTGEHKTSHFALCTGFMALGMMLPGMVSGEIADSLVKAFPQAPNLGWTWFFIIVCIATIPGFIMLKFIPLDKEFGRRHQ